MFGNPDEDYDIPFASSQEDDDDYAERRGRRLHESLCVISRYCLLVTQEPDGPPFTHVCGVPVNQIKSMMESYAAARNMGIDEMRRKYPWECGA